jgi:hypothetical protein
LGRSFEFHFDGCAEGMANICGKWSENGLFCAAAGQSLDCTISSISTQAQAALTERGA